MIIFSKRKIYEQIDKHKIISFDIFDTLIKRNCKNPKDIFEIVQNEYNKCSDNQISNFKIKRIKAEENARIKNSEFEDITLDEIYQCFEFDENQKEKLKKLEKKVELDFCQKNNEMFEVYKYCKNKNKIIICTTDMYLPRNIIEKILKNSGYNISRIFISNEERKSKGTGNLFKVVLDELKCNKKDVLHIGDGLRSDLLGATIAGIDTFHIQTKVNNLNQLKEKDLENIDINTNIISSFINNNIDSNKNYFYNIGYELYGPLCLQMSIWINSIAKKEKINNILFCARDMKVMQYIYDMYFHDNKISNNYFYVSRKSTYLPYLYLHQDYKDFINFFPTTVKKVTVSEILNLYNIKIKNENEVLQNYDLSPDNKYTTKELVKNKNFIKLYDEVIKNVINTDGKEQYNCFLNYLYSLNIGKSTALVDLGWRGSTQKIIDSILGYNIKGIYLGLNDKKYDFKSNEYWTYLFDGNNNKYFHQVTSILAFIELFFSALHGSTVGYTNNSRKPYILGKGANENNADIKNIHNGAIKFANDFIKYKEYISDSNNKTFADKIIEIGINPTLRQSKNLGKIYTENLSKRQIACPKKTSFYIFHLSTLKNDFLASEWKIGFMKNLFKIKLPYYKIYWKLKGDKG